MNILIFTSFNSRSSNIEGYCNSFQKEGHRVILLTIVEKGLLHQAVESLGIETHVLPFANLGFFNRIKKLREFVKEHQIDIVFSHLQQPNLYTSILSKLIHVKVVTVRHNSDVIYLSGTKKERIIQKVINSLSPNIVAISDKVRDVILTIEKGKDKKVHQINNGYDFSFLDELYSPSIYEELKDKYKGCTVLLSPGRLLTIKRFDYLIESIAILKEKHPTIRLIILGRGEEKSSLLKLIKDQGLNDFIELHDFTDSIASYYKLADMTIQMSISEASNNVIKEALYYDNLVLACKDVGDFDSYLPNDFLIQKEASSSELADKISFLIQRSSETIDQVQKTKNKMLENFSIENVAPKYLALFEKL